MHVFSVYQVIVMPRGRNAIPEKPRTYMEFLSRKELVEHVPTQGSIILKGQGFLQNFVRPNTEYNCTIKATWTPLVTMLERRTNRNRVSDHKVDHNMRAVTFEEEGFCESVLMKAEGTLATKLLAQAAAVAKHVSDTTKRQIAKLVLHFKVDYGNEIWLLYCSEFKMMPPVVSLRVGSKGLTDAQMEEYRVASHLEFTCVVTDKKYPQTEKFEVPYRLLIKHWNAFVDTIEEPESRRLAQASVPPPIKRDNAELTAAAYFRLQHDPQFLDTMAPVCRTVSSTLDAFVMESVQQHLDTGLARTAAVNTGNSPKARAHPHVAAAGRGSGARPTKAPSPAPPDASNSTAAVAAQPSYAGGGGGPQQEPGISLPSQPSAYPAPQPSSQHLQPQPSLQHVQPQPSSQQLGRQTSLALAAFSAQHRLVISTAHFYDNWEAMCSPAPASPLRRGIHEQASTGYVSFSPTVRRSSYAGEAPSAGVSRSANPSGGGAPPAAGGGGQPTASKPPMSPAKAGAKAAATTPKQQQRKPGSAGEKPAAAASETDTEPDVSDLPPELRDVLVDREKRTLQMLDDAYAEFEEQTAALVSWAKEVFDPAAAQQAAAARPGSASAGGESSRRTTVQGEALSFKPTLTALSLTERTYLGSTPRGAHSTRSQLPAGSTRTPRASSTTVSQHAQRPPSSSAPAADATAQPAARPSSSDAQPARDTRTPPAACATPPKGAATPIAAGSSTPTRGTAAAAARPPSAAASAAGNGDDEAFRHSTYTFEPDSKKRADEEKNELTDEERRMLEEALLAQSRDLEDQSQAVAAQ